MSTWEAYLKAEDLPTPPSPSKDPSTRPIYYIAHGAKNDNRGQGKSDMQRLAELGIQGGSRDYIQMIETQRVAHLVAAKLMPPGYRERIPIHYMPGEEHQAPDEIVREPLIGPDDEAQHLRFRHQSHRLEKPMQLKRLIWACDKQNLFPDELWHNAGNDAWITLVCAVHMFILLDHDILNHTQRMPVFVSMDFEGATRKGTGDRMTEIGVAVLDLGNIVTKDGIDPDHWKSIQSYHTLIEGLEHLHPEAKNERDMGIWRSNPNDGRRPRWNFEFGPNKRAKKIIAGATPGTTVQMSKFTDIIPVDRAAEWIRSKYPRNSGIIRKPEKSVPREPWE